MDLTDESLLRQYVETGHQPSFRELVRRHLDLVHSVAWRHLRSDALAADVCQLVFTDLAQSAATFQRGQPVVAWLHLVARRTAIDLVRQEQRRHVREQTAAELATVNRAVPWTQFEPVLDEALDSLDTVDRQALLLRYFENHSLRDVGAALGTTDDAAQKRVSRALDRLRDELLRRGFAAATAAGLAVELAGATSPAPAAILGSTLAGTAASTGTIAAQAAAVSTLKYTLIATTLVLAAGLVWETHALAATRRQVVEQETGFQNKEAAHRQAAEESRAASADLATARLRLATGEARVAEKIATEATLGAWLERVGKLRRQVTDSPAHRIPEMDFLTDRDWLLVTRDNPLAGEMQLRRALADLRRLAKEQPEVNRNLTNAMRDFGHAHPGQVPVSVLDLQPYFKPALSNALLARYELVPPGMANIQTKTWVLIEKTLIDGEFDTQYYHGLDGSSGNFFSSNRGSTVNYSQIFAAFSRDHPNEFPTRSSQLEPYLPATINVATFRDYWAAIRLPYPQ